MIRRIGALSIGESPRPDLMVEIETVVPPGRILQWGALDGFHPDEITREQYQIPLITKLQDQTVLVERAWMVGRLQELIDQHHDRVDAFIVLCAEDFSSLSSPVPLFIPYVLASKTLRASGFQGELGVVCPVVGQVPSCREKWAGGPWRAHIEVASPFTPGDMEGAVERLVDSGSQFILLDCTSFSREQARRLSRTYQRSVVAVRSFAWAVLAELMAAAP